MSKLIMRFWDPSGIMVDRAPATRQPDGTIVAKAPSQMKVGRIDVIETEPRTTTLHSTRSLNSDWIERNDRVRMTNYGEGKVKAHASRSTD